MKLYHFSEDPNITSFTPRSPIANPEKDPFVWAIDEERSPLYFLPRDCPRACFWLLGSTNDLDRKEYLQTTSARIVIAVEFGWLERIQSASLYRYRMPTETFVPEGDSPERRYGAYISRAKVVPISVEPLDDLLEAMRRENIEIRLCQSLSPFATSLVKTSLHYSLIRMRNAIL